MAAAGATPEDIAKCMLVQTALLSKGISPDALVSALQQIMDGSGSKGETVSMIEAVLKNEAISIEDINKMLSVQKALDGGKIRGLKEVQRIIEEGGTGSAEELAETLGKAIESGALDRDAVAKTLLLQMAMTSSGASPATLAKSILLQKSMAENGMAVHEVANAMSLAMTLGGKADESLASMKGSFSNSVLNGLTQEDVQIVMQLKKALEEEEIPKEAINLMRKAMKQRRGSVDNVAETLMASLAASGQSQESIAKAMVKALQATGATPQEIAKTMQQAMAKSGASQEEIAKAMAAAMANSGASGQ